jgi:hypothetical protein
MAPGPPIASVPAPSAVSLPPPPSRALIASLGSQCLKLFGALLRRLEAVPPNSDKEKATAALLRDEMGRFRIWAGSTNVFRMNGDDTSWDPTDLMGRSASISRETFNCLLSLQDTLGEGTIQSSTPTLTLSIFIFLPFVDFIKGEGHL